MAASGAPAGDTHRLLQCRLYTTLNSFKQYNIDCDGAEARLDLVRSICFDMQHNHRRHSHIASQYLKAHYPNKPRNEPEAIISSLMEVRRYYNGKLESLGHQVFRRRRRLLRYAMLITPQVALDE